MNNAYFGFWFLFVLWGLFSVITLAAIFGVFSSMSKCLKRLIPQKKMWRQGLSKAKMRSMTKTTVNGIDWEVQRRLHSLGQVPPFEFIYLMLGSDQLEVRHLIWVEVLYAYEVKWVNVNHVPNLDKVKAHASFLDMVQKHLKDAGYKVTTKPADELVRDRKIIRGGEYIQCAAGIVLRAELRFLTRHVK